MKTDFTASDVVERLAKDEAFRREFIALLAELAIILKPVIASKAE